MSDLSSLVRKIRGKDSLREAHKKTGISHNYWHVMERGIDPRTKSPVKPSPDTLKAISEGYNYPYEELMKVAGYIDEGKVVKLKEELQKITGMPKSEERKKKVADFMQEFLKLPEETQDNFYDLIKNMPKK